MRAGHVSLHIARHSRNRRVRAASNTHLARLAANHAKQVGALLVRAALIAGVTSCAFCFEELGARISTAIVRTRHFLVAANNTAYARTHTASGTNFARVAM